MAKIDLSNISHSYNPNDPNPVYALNPFSMTWENGNRYAILGPSGCGKTTMLNIVSGLVRPSAGRILFDDKDVTDLKTEDRNIAQVFQFPVIYNTMTVYENLAFPLKCRDFSKSKTDERVNSVAETLNLKSFLNSPARKLTADQKQLISLGTPIYKERSKFMTSFISIFKKYYSEISSENELVDINFKSDLNSGSFSEVLSESLSKDRFLQYTSKGVHKDDLIFTLDGNKIKNFGSQGQQKSFLIALKLAQFDYYRTKFGNSPIVLLDDIFDKLDQERVRQIVQILEKKDFSQIFITDTHIDRVKDALSESKNKEEIFDLEKLKCDD